MSDEGEPVPHLLRDPAPSRTSGRKVLIGVAVFFLLLVGFVLTLVFTIGIHNNGVKIPQTSPIVTASPDASKPPSGFFALTPPGVPGSPAGETEYVTADGVTGVRPPHLRAVALGLAPKRLRAYSAYPERGCRTKLEVLTYLPHWHHAVGLNRFGDVTTIEGRAERTPMAVSPDGTKLALAVDAQDPEASTCSGDNALLVVDLLSHEVRTWSTGTRAGAWALDNLAWAPDGVRLAYRLSATSATDGGGTRVFDTTKPGASLPDSAVVLPATAPGGAAYGPVVWWHGKLAVFAGTSLRSLGANGVLGAVLATGFPENVLTASVSRNGAWVLLNGGNEFTQVPSGVTYGTTYRWHDGHATTVDGKWIQPAW